MSESPGMLEERLRVCLQDHYHLAAVVLEALSLGLDRWAVVYRVIDEQGASYLLKARAGAFYEPSCLVPRCLSDQGITAVVAPLPTRTRSLWTQVEDWVVTVYPFIEGEMGWTPGLTDAQWAAVGTALRQIHQARLPPEGVPSLRKETFDPTAYGRSVQNLEARHSGAQRGSQAEQVLRSSWRAHQPTIHKAIATLEWLAPALQKQAGPYVLCHADLHPGNIIRQPNEVFLIDWDEVMLAPKERDFLFVEVAPADGSVSYEAAPFFQGYGQTEMDWGALTYYLWERLIQDVIAFAEEVFSRDDLSEATKADSAALFQAMFAEEGGAANKALAATASLSAALRLSKRKYYNEH